MAGMLNDVFADVSLDDPTTREHCEPCFREGETVEGSWFCIDCGDYLCDGCCKAHRKIKSLQKHTILDKEQAKKHTKDREKTDEASDFVSFSTSASHDTTCSIHSLEPEEHFWRGLHVLCCSECISTKHNGCDTVNLPRMSENITGSPDMAQQKRAVDVVTQGVRAIRDKMDANLEEIEAKHSGAGEAFRDLMEGVMTMFETLWSDVAVTTRVSSETNKEQCMYVKCRALNVIEEINKAEQIVRDMKISPTRRKKKVLARSMQGVKGALQRIEIPEGDRNHNHKDTLASLSKVRTLAELLNNCVYDEDSVELPDHETAPFSLKSADDTETPMITGALVTTDRMIVADRGNKKIKMFDTMEKELLAELKLSVPLDAD